MTKHTRTSRRYHRHRHISINNLPPLGHPLPLPRLPDRSYHFAFHPHGTPFEYQIVELLRTAHLLFVYDHLFSLVICGFIEISLEIVFVAAFVRPSAEFSIHIIGVIFIDRHWDRVTDCCR
ncbi:BZ3500_MvSof-1268-A1-R1_Chr1-3g01633 [Microbotryum saponariae]|uniref:BZ3500_MvSof-1268-A1-R1_Chr1-3g01633 protein n=1 Tax=Microbotryum saponariae TaxID=289078 RepID=A0A2X0KBY2_9BASI|nr:BZ3500_MvSof-1268-A1-R1_Chr1-3g01633 [Microbotryum saponariae]SCZ94193.1 BZ3501_MvSof-1269-A2-R1_Chr1-3g01234 [Microbotryum saponariae]